MRGIGSSSDSMSEWSPCASKEVTSLILTPFSGRTLAGKSNSPFRVLW